METSMFICGLAVCFAFIGAVLCVRAVSEAFSYRRSVDAAMGLSGQGGVVSWRMRNGFELVKGAARALLRRKKVRELMGEGVFWCNRRGYATDEVALLSIALVSGFAIALASGFLASSVIAVVAVPTGVAALVAVGLSGARDKRREAVHDAVPIALEAMGSCFASGFTLLQTFSQVSQDMDGPLADTFARAAHVLEVGGNAEDALAELKNGAYASELAFVAVALDVQHQSGGAIRQVLEAAADSVKGELALRRSLRVQTAQARLSARVVAVMPLLLVAAFSLVSPDFMAPFFSSVFGYALLVIAIAMQVTGIVLVRRALSVEGVS